MSNTNFKVPEPTVKRKNLLFKIIPCKTTLPWQSHPQRYWKMDSKRFIDMYEEAKSKDADLVLVNISKTSEEVKLMRVIYLNENEIKTSDKKLTQDKYESYVKEIGNIYNIVK